jgi:hypothetical protein
MDYTLHAGMESYAVVMFIEYRCAGYMILWGGDMLFDCYVTRLYQCRLYICRYEAALQHVHGTATRITRFRYLLTLWIHLLTPYPTENSHLRS